MILNPKNYFAPPEVIICGTRITDPDTARLLEIIAHQLEIERETGIVGRELAEIRLKRKQKQLKGATKI